MTKSAQVIINNTKSNSSQWNSHLFQSSVGILWCTRVKQLKIALYF